MEDDSFPPPPRVGIAYNLKKGVRAGTEDAEAEYDSFDTIRAIRGALESAGCGVALLEADAGFVEKVKSAGVDIVFNIAEGANGRGREAQVPAVLSFLGVPYTGSDETALGIALDKAMTKRYLSAFGVETPAAVLADSPDAEGLKALRFPVIVKPDCEGSGKGIGELATAGDAGELRALLERDLRLYGGPMLAEEYITGREFTVGLLGNGEDLRVFEPMEIRYRRGDPERGVYSYRVKTNYREYVDYECPAAVPPAVSDAMKRVSAKIFRALGCRDLARIDFRLSRDGVPYFIEINPLPGLAPGYSDYPMLAGFCGVGYGDLILRILRSAMERYGMVPAAKAEVSRA